MTVQINRRGKKSAGRIGPDPAIDSLLLRITSSQNTHTMRLLSHTLSCLLAATCVTAASSWGFDDATVSIHEKKAAVGGLKEK